MRGEIRDLSIAFALAVLLAVNSGDLLYLYFIGAWHDPIKWLEYAEVASEFLFAISGLILSAIYLRKMARR
jgi:hypothetical protein